MVKYCAADGELLFFNTSPLHSPSGEQLTLSQRRLHLTLVTKCAHQTHQVRLLTTCLALPFLYMPTASQAIEKKVEDRKHTLSKKKRNRFLRYRACSFC